ncbi:MAG: CobD/CbiB family cobalamin biosynthesis protein [Halolamina sp.]
MSALAAVAVGLAAAADAVVAEPPTRLHPVAWFGRVASAVDREWSRPRFVGSLAAVGLPLVAAGTTAAVVVGLARIGAAVGGSELGRAAGTVAAAATLFVTTSRTMLLTEAAAVVDASDSDPAAARERVPSLVGRDPESLSPAELRSAAVESAAENLADGLVAPLVGFVVGVAAVSGVSAVTVGKVGFSSTAGAAFPTTAPLAVGAGLAAWVKAVNTLDSMLGYRSKPAGWAPARLDDAAMWLPARLSAVLVAVAAADAGALRRGAALADRPPSPNSGWPMATLAAALPTRLRKPGGYDLAAADSLPTPATARCGVAVVGRAGWLAVVAAAVVAGVVP